MTLLMLFGWGDPVSDLRDPTLDEKGQQNTLPLLPYNNLSKFILNLKVRLEFGVKKEYRFDTTKTPDPT